MDTIFKCEADYERYWENIPEVEATPFLDNVDDIIKHSYVFKAMRSEFEIDNTFTKKSIKILKSGELDLDVDKRTKLPIDMIVPGFTYKSFIPTSSIFSSNEMFQLFQIALSLSKNESLTQPQLKTLSNSSEKLQSEQAAFMKYASEQWNFHGVKKHNEIKPDVLEFVNRVWKAKIDRVFCYPKFYSETCVIPLTESSNFRVELKLCATLKTIGSKVKKYFFPNLRQYKLNTEDVLERMVKDDSKQSFTKLNEAKYHPEISKDESASELAIENDAQIVISTSAFTALLNHSNLEGAWDIPFSVKQLEKTQGMKKVVFIDKKLPPKVMTVEDRNKYFAKYALKKLIASPPTSLRVKTTFYNHIDLETFGIDEGSEPLAFRNDKKKIDLSDQNNTESDVEVVKEEASSPVDQNDKSSEMESEEDKMFIDECSDLDNGSKMNENEQDGNKKNEFQQIEQEKTEQLLKSNPKKFKNDNDTKKESKGKNKKLNFVVDYRLWEMKSLEEKSILCKRTQPKNLTLIIRTITEGKSLVKNKLYPCKISTKLEYQPEYGAEAVTITEVLKEWVSLIVRPGANLARVRLNPLTGEVIQFEKKNLAEVTMDCQRLHKINPYERLSVLHSIFQILSNLPLGNYIMKYDPKNNSFIYIMGEATRNHTFNLFLEYNCINTEELPSQRSPWNPLDTTVITPSFYQFCRVPCCFAPRTTYRKSKMKDIPPKRKFKQEATTVEKKSKTKTKKT